MQSSKFNSPWRLALLTRVTHLGVGADWRLALLTGVGEQVLVALDAVGVLLAQDVAMSRQRHVAVEAAEVAAVPVLLHRLGVLAREDQLSTHTATKAHITSQAMVITHVPVR